MVHTFERGGLMLALDTESGAVHLLDRLAFLLLKGTTRSELSQYTDEQVQKATAELNELKQKKELFTPANTTARQKAVAATPVIKAACLHIAHACNLECRYCFAKGGKFGGESVLMSFEVAKKTIDFLVKVSKHRKNIEIDFFGGEPLMNFEVVKQTVLYAKSIEKQSGKYFRFTLTTNGVALTEEIESFVNEHMFNVVISLDGRPNVNDENRKTLNGKGSHDIIMPKYKSLIAGRGDKSYYIRGTYTAQNLDFYNDVFYMKEQGFSNISVEPVSGEETCEYAITREHLEEIERSYEKVYDYLCATDDFTFFHFEADLGGGPCAIKRIRGCGAGCEYIAITPTGDIYPCHQFVGEERYRLGDLDVGIERKDVVKSFFDTTLLTKPECDDCFAKYFCSGGCAAASYKASGDIKGQDSMYCELMRMRTEFALCLAVQRALR